MEKKQILITDDSFVSRKKIRKMLESQGYHCEEAANGKEGIEKLLSGSYDLMLLDLLMPEFDGFYALERIKESAINVPIIVISADIQDTSKAKVKAYGVNDFLNKPPKENELQDTISKLLNLDM